MNETMTEKFFVKNIDCANCAAKIENGLRKLDGVDYVSLDFANQTLHVKTSDLDRIIEHVRKIEPDVELVPQRQKSSSEESVHQATDYSLKKEITVLTAAFLLFSVELLASFI